MARVDTKDIELRYNEKLDYQWRCYFRGEECELTMDKDVATLSSLDLDIKIGTTDMATILRLIKAANAPIDIKTKTVITYVARAQGRDPLELMRAKLIKQ